MKYIASPLLLFTSLAFSDVRIQTLDSWNIESYTPDSLMIRKESEKSDNYLAFEMNRPFCICEDLSFIIYENNDLKPKQEIEGKEKSLITPTASCPI